MLPCSGSGYGNFGSNFCSPCAVESTGDRFNNVWTQIMLYTRYSNRRAPSLEEHSFCWLPAVSQIPVKPTPNWVCSLTDWGIAYMVLSWHWHLNRVFHSSWSQHIHLFMRWHVHVLSIHVCLAWCRASSPCEEPQKQLDEPLSWRESITNSPWVSSFGCLRSWRLWLLSVIGQRSALCDTEQSLRRS